MSAAAAATTTVVVASSVAAPSVSPESKLKTKIAELTTLLTETEQELETGLAETQSKSKLKHETSRSSMNHLLDTGLDGLQRAYSGE